MKSLTLMKTGLLICFISFTLSAFSKELKVEGHYYGYNIYVLNPSVSADSFSVKEVYVNGKKTKDEIESNGFEIDLEALNLSDEQSVIIKIVYSKKATPLVINPEDLLPPDKFHFTTVRVKKEQLQFRIRGNTGSSNFVVEQFRWNRWLEYYEIDVNDTLRANQYSLPIIPHFGYNEFRVKKTNKYGELIVSKKIKYYNKSAAVTILKKRISPNEELTFSAETDYEIYDEKGNLLLKGTDRYVDISSLSRGNYFVNFDNSSEVITKKK